VPPGLGEVVEDVSTFSLGQNQVDLLTGLDLGALLVHRGIWGLLMQHFLNFLPEPDLP